MTIIMMALTFVSMGLLMAVDRYLFQKQIKELKKKIEERETLLSLYTGFLD